jgi:hypothetical protein
MCSSPRGTLPSNILLNALKSAFFGTCFVAHDCGVISQTKFCPELSEKLISIDFSAAAPRDRNGMVNFPPVPLHLPERAAAID